MINFSRLIIKTLLQRKLVNVADINKLSSASLKWDVTKPENQKKGAFFNPPVSGFRFSGGVRYGKSGRSFYSSGLLGKKRTPREDKTIPPDLMPPTSKFKKQRVIKVWPNMTVNELAMEMNFPLDTLLEALEYVPNTEKYNSPNSKIDNFQTLTQAVKLLGLRWLIAKNTDTEEKVKKDSRDVYKQPPPDPKNLVSRNPVVTIMGHVDHGKTTLLDRLRNSSIVDKEFGGITQHIGAFSVDLPDNQKITFLDTPGHAAFTAMRSRGAKVTDIVILVVAADDGVMPQTVESIRMANEANVPMIVAMNKVDKPHADIDKVKRGLIENNVLVEEYGGEVQAVAISALKGTNIDALMEAVQLQAELMELKADPTGLVEGVIIESRHCPNRGRLGTAIIQRGTLKNGKVIIAGTGWGKVRMMYSDKMAIIKEAGPSTPVEIMGWKVLPSAGDILLEVSSEKKAREIIHWRQSLKMEEKAKLDAIEVKKKLEEHLSVYKPALEEKRKEGWYKKPSLGDEIGGDSFENAGTLGEDKTPKVVVLIKGDVHGSVEAIVNVLSTYKSDLCYLKIVHQGVGNVSVSDVNLAEAFNGVIYAFNVDVLPEAKPLLKSKEVQVRHHNIIYKLVDDLKDLINSRLPELDEEEILGEATVLQQFIVTEGRRKLPVAGVKCTKGILKKNSLFKIMRRNELIHRGRLVSMRSHKDEVNLIRENNDCGLRFEDTSVVAQKGDTVLCVTFNKKKQSIVWNPGF